MTCFLFEVLEYLTIGQHHSSISSVSNWDNSSSISTSISISGSPANNSPASVIWSIISSTYSVISKTRSALTVTATSFNSVPISASSSQFIFNQILFYIERIKLEERGKKNSKKSECSIQSNSLE
ncbi:hypothetical protein WKT22_04853 [Candidatus Lokiarchaeum ossiferum]